MERIKVGLVQLAWAGTRAAMIDDYRRLVYEAAARGAELICLPELSLSPYFPVTTDPAGFDWAEPLPGGETERLFSELARAHRVAIISSLVEKTEDGHVFDTAILHQPDGALGGVTRKIHIPSGAGYNETHFFEAGTTYPVHAVRALAVAAPTCYDQWFPELARIYALNGAEFLFYPTAIGSEPTAPEVDTQDAWRTVMRGHAVANGVYIGAANRVGVEQGQTFYGGSFVCDPMGRVIAQAGRDTTEVITAELDPDLFAEWRRLFPLLGQRQPGVYGRLTERSGA
ncbi:MAG: hydrolase [Anaerolineae bacterium]|nr:hydrolase [Anaerolineae bacterium]NUQ06099.1 hydrolase [Anaerolineae bacterium]